MDLKQNKFGRFGAYGYVFKIEDDQAVKLYFKSDTVSKEDIRSVFNSEVKAYGIASQDADLSKYIPKYFGPVNVRSVLDNKDKDISNDYYLDMAIQNGVY